MSASQGTIHNQIGDLGDGDAVPDDSHGERRSERILEAFRAERLAGLRLATTATVGTMIAIAVLLPFLSRPPWLFAYEAGVAALALVMLAHYRVQRAAPEQLWISYLFVVLTMIVMTLVMTLPETLIEIPWPSQMTLRNGTAVYYFVLIALVSLNYSPGLVICAGVTSVLSRLTTVAVFANAPDSLTRIRFNEDRTPEEILAIVLDPRFVSWDTITQNLVVMLLVTAVLAAAVARSRRLVERQARIERERGNLARYFPPQIVDRLSRNDDALSTVRAQSVAVLFADIVGFTKYAERETPEHVIALLRGFHRRLEQAVFGNGGTLDKFLGDGLMATFGTPQNGPRDALNALAAAEAMQQTVADWNHAREAAGLAPIRLSLGLHYGPVVLGDIGSERRMEFAVIGDTVNVANRLEGQSRSLDCKTVASAALVEQARQEAPEEAERLLTDYRPSEPQVLRGRIAPVPVWIAGEAAAASI